MDTRVKSGIFSPHRFGQLLRREITGGYRSMLIAMAAVAGTVIMVSALSMIGVAEGSVLTVGGQASFHPTFYLQLLFIGGFILTSLAFREARQNGSAIFYLTIPGSLLEKFASKLVVTAAGYGAGSLVFYTALSAASEGINTLVFGARHVLFNPFDVSILRAVLAYMVLQSLFLLGSIWFRKLAFVRTVLWISVVAIGAVVVGAIAARIFLADHFSWHEAGVGEWRFGGWSLDLPMAYLRGRFGPGGTGEPGARAFLVGVEVLFWAAFAPVCWLAAYFKLGEVEA